MSYTTQPSFSKTTRGRGTRGRGRGRGNPPPTTLASSSTTRREETDGAVGGQDRVDRAQRRDAYTLFSPNEKKRDKIQQDAQKEEETFKKYKESRRLGHVSYVGTVGGGLSHSESIQQRNVQQKMQPSPARRAALTRSNEKKEEEKVLNHKKVAARQKAGNNERRETERHAKLDEERRRVNEAFLRRLEQGSK